GNVTVDNHVKDVVAIFGNVNLGPNARVDGDVVCIAGTITRDPLSTVRRQITNVGRSLPVGAGISAWFSECLLKGRLLGLGTNLGWAWIVALSFLAFYILLAL